MNDSDLVEYTISVEVPDEIRTRAAATGSIGESGLFEYENRNIDRLFYAIYYDDEMLTSTTITRPDNNPFTITYKTETATDPSKLYFFFWADNSNDKRDSQTNSAIQIYDRYKYVKVDYNYLHNSSKAFNIFDCFTNYIQFSTVANTGTKASVVLKRPFAEFHILTDELTDSELALDYTKGTFVYSAFGNNKVNNNKASRESNFLLPTKWHYDTDEFEFEYITDFKFTNPLNGDTPYRTNFKGRQMEYLSCFYVLAPRTKKPFENKVNSESIIYDKLNFSVLKSTSVTGLTSSAGSDTAHNVCVQLPEEGIQANNRYIIYNMAREDGGTGFFPTIYTLEVNENQEWDGTNQSEKGENRL